MPSQSPAADPHEIELKFRVDPARAEAVFAAVAGEDGRVRSLSATYFDTPTGVLAKAGMALRVRTDGKAWVQTLKTAQANGGGMGRGEWEASTSGPKPDIGLLKGTPAQKALGRSRKLQPLFTVEVERRQAVRLVEGASIEVALDRGRVVAGERSEPILELELELKSGKAADLLAFAADVRRAHGLALSFTTKAGRGMALKAKAGARAVKFRAPRISAGMTAGEGFKAVARAALEQAVSNAERLAQAPGPEVIHQMRVGVRRLRSAISSFRPVVADRRVAALKAELKWLTGELDQARNLDVLLAGAYRRATRRKADPTGLADLGRQLRLNRTAAYARAHAAAESERFRALVMDILVWIEVGPWTRRKAEGAAARDRSLADFADKALGRRRRKVLKRCGDLAGMSREARHHLRIDCKKLRYAADALSALSDKPRRVDAFINALKALQDRLGELNDIATGETLARGLTASADIAGTTDWAAGRLIGGETAREAALIQAAAEAAKAFKAAKPFWD
ncbi:CHAD domain-containing protein [Caulobacter sp. KR2-114]|uniref:CYTH and CHAD domain-containing protein n=1 Tax=Caulobacter sp. KR2-114 TaxID=3400912 RepID=UPI003C05DBCF